MQYSLAEIQPPAPSPIAALIPFVVLGIITGLIVCPIAKRKGSNPIAWFLIGCIPFFGWLAILRLVSRPDVELVRRIGALEDEVAKLKK
jgi:xanthosine utilization system XapX-like protein